MMNEREYIRDLASKLFDYGSMQEQQEKIKLIKACNDLKPVRPIVFARPENGWSDLHEKWGSHKCEDRRLRVIEDSLLKGIIRAEHIPDDMPVLPEYRVPLRILNNGYNDFGVQLEVTETEREKGAYHIEPAIRNWEDIKKLHFRKLGVDREGSREDMEFAHALLGDILDVYTVGVTDWRYGLTRVLIHMRGFQQFLMDMYDYPEETHNIIQFLADNFANEMDYYTKENLISPNTLDNDYIGVGGPCATDDLPGREHQSDFGVKDCAVWAESQETIGVSPAQFEEYVFKYQKPLVDQFGLCGYGCCEGLEGRFDILKKGLDNLRWIAVSPWADAEKMAEQIGRDYVYLYKVNPALVVSPQADWEAAEKQVRNIKRLTDGMSVQFSLKDTNTFCNEPERIIRWVDMAMKIAAE
ncbi:MAG: hypothetical protein JEY99_21875 [Spirochaetales bacterium]|nr:hypothetical protein [Spirochaetales bacterium]